MGKKNTRLLMAATVFLLALALAPTAGSGAGTGYADCEEVTAAELAGKVSSLAELRNKVAVSIAKITKDICEEIRTGAGAAGGRLITATEDKKDSDDKNSNQGYQAAEKDTREKYDPYNVYDYDSADAFADDYVYEFAEEFYDDEDEESAYDDAYDEACDYWESKHR